MPADDIKFLLEARVHTSQLLGKNKSLVLHEWEIQSFPLYSICINKNQLFSISVK